MNFPLPFTPICAQYSRRQNDPLASLIPQFDWVSLSSFLSSLRFSACWLGPPCQTSVSVLTRVRRLSCIGVPGIPSQPVTNFSRPASCTPREPFVRLFPFLPAQAVFWFGAPHILLASHISIVTRVASYHEFLCPQPRLLALYPLSHPPCLPTRHHCHPPLHLLV